MKDSWKSEDDKMYKIPMDRSTGAGYVYLPTESFTGKINKMHVNAVYRMPSMLCDLTTEIHLYKASFLDFSLRSSRVYKDINNMLWIGSFETSDLSQNLKSIFWSKSRWLLQWDSFWESWCITTGQKGNPKHCPQELLNQLIFLFLSVTFMAFVLLTSSNGECTGDKVAFETLERMVNALLKHPPDGYPAVN